MQPSDAKDLLEVGNRVCLVVAPNSPELSAATGQQSTEVIGINENACLHRKIHHLLGSIGTVKLLLNFRVTIHLMAEVIEGIQKGLCVALHAA